jgi:hypothetical protein
MAEFYFVRENRLHYRFNTFGKYVPIYINEPLVRIRRALNSDLHATSSLSIESFIYLSLRKLEFVVIRDSEISNEKSPR